MGRLTFSRNRSSAATIEAHLRKCDADFSRSLSTRVSLREYAAKLASHAERSEAWAGTRLVGLVAMYPPSVSGECFISNVSVDPMFRRLGLGRHLLNDSIDIALNLGAARLSLDVDVESQVAQHLYCSMGFDPVMGGPSRWVREFLYHPSLRRETEGFSSAD